MNKILKLEYLIRIYELISKYLKKKIELYNIIYNNPNNICNKIINFIILTYMFFCIIYVFIIIINGSNSYLYYNLTNAFRNNPSIVVYPEYKQIIDLYYINDWFSLDTNLILIFFLIITFFISVYKLKTTINDIYENLNNIIPLFLFTLLLLSIYYIYNYNNLNKLSININSMKELIYNNINIEFLKKGVCKYDKENICNNINLNYNNNIYKYIYDILEEINLNQDTTVMNVNDFKKLIDKNGVNYYNKILKAFYTNNLIKYYIKNNLFNEGIKFFSIDNLINHNINPFLYLKINDLSLLQSNYNFDDKMKKSFFDNNLLFFAILKDYYELEYNTTNLITNIYNFCKFKIYTIYISYSIICMIIFILISLYIYNNY